MYGNNSTFKELILNYIIEEIKKEEGNNIYGL